MDVYNFQYCQKIVVFNNDDTKVLLARRADEQDFNNTFTFIGGKLETTDESIVDGMRREKNEEIGQQCKLLLLPTYSHNVLYRKEDGSSMILPHYYAQLQEGEITLSSEYDRYEWASISELESFEAKVPNIPHIYKMMLNIKSLAQPNDFIII